MKKKIFLSIALSTLFFVLLSYFSIFGILYSTQIRTAKKNLEEATLLLSDSYKNNELDLISSFVHPNFRLTLIDSNGHVLHDSHSTLLENHSDRPEFQNALESGVGESQRYSSTLEKTTYYYATKLDDNLVLRLSFTTASIFNQFSSSLIPLLIIFSFIITGSLIIAHFLTKSILAPIHNLNLDYPLPSKAYPELHPLIERLCHHNQLRKEFTSNVSHELKTPLTSIQGYAEIMENNLQGNKTQEFSQKIVQESKRLLSLIQDILKLSKLDEGNIPLEFQVIDYSELVTQVLSTLTPLANQNGVTLHFQKRSCYGDGVSTILSEILTNLIQNAIKYNHPQGNVWISCADKKNFIHISVKDDGNGIKPEEQSRIFERFYRTEESRNLQIEGTGLGLSIVKHGVEFHCGSIQVESSSHGTTFNILFPKRKNSTTIK